MKPKRLTPQQLKTQQQLDRISSAFKQAMAAAQYPQAMQEALRAHKLIPQAVAPLSDAATAAVKGSLWHEAITHAKKALQRQSGHLNSLDALAHAYGGLHDWANCRAYGLQALQLRDSQVMAALDAAPLPALPANGPGKQIISFSLFGNRAEYIEPAVMNTELAAAVYPGWVCRFYVDGSVPEPALQRLRGNGAEIVRVPPELENWPGTMWRFLALDDAEAARVIFRDADSVISPREARAVAEWVQSGRWFPHLARRRHPHRIGARRLVGRAGRRRARYARQNAGLCGCGRGFTPFCRPMVFAGKYLALCAPKPVRPRPYFRLYGCRAFSRPRTV